MSYLIFACGIIIGAVAALAIKANQHHSTIRRIIEEVDDLVSKAEDISSAKWHDIRKKF